MRRFKYIGDKPATFRDRVILTATEKQILFCFDRRKTPGTGWVRRERFRYPILDQRATKRSREILTETESQTRRSIARRQERGGREDRAEADDEEHAVDREARTVRVPLSVAVAMTTMPVVAVPVRVVTDALKVPGPPGLCPPDLCPPGLCPPSVRAP